jgi:hypothetical protein
LPVGSDGPPSTTISTSRLFVADSLTSSLLSDDLHLAERQQLAIRSEHDLVSPFRRKRTLRHVEEEAHLLKATPEQEPSGALIWSLPSAALL